MVAQQPNNEALEPLESVLRRTASKRSTVYAWIAQGLFPPPIRIGPRRVAWRKSDIDTWIAQVIAQSQQRRHGDQ